MKIFGFRALGTTGLLCFIAVGMISCGRGREANRNIAPTPVLSEFEKDLQYARQANLAHTYVVARRDGAPLDRDDKEYLVRNTPAETSMRISTDGDRRVILTSNFDLSPENREALVKRFTIETPPAK